MDPVEQVGTAEQRLLQMLLKGLPTTDRLAETLAGSGSARAAGRELPTSELRFPDGAAFRIEIPSVEGPACLEAVLGEAERLEVPVRRVSQGSGVMLLTDEELRQMASAAAAAGVEVSLFARPCAGWGVSASAAATSGAAFSSVAHGVAQLAAVVADMERAAAHGIRSVLVSDIGALAMFGGLRSSGSLPQDMQAKTSVMLPVANPATAFVVAALGASTINVQTDLPLAEISAIRSVVDVPIDVYVESPDNVGGFLRYEELSELVRVAAPVYLKFGLRNAPDVYPSGSHLDALTVALSKERVRRARIGLESLARAGVDVRATSAPGAAGLAVPVPGDGAPTRREVELEGAASDGRS